MKVFGAGNASPSGFNARATALSCPGRMAMDVTRPSRCSDSRNPPWATGQTPDKGDFAISSGTQFCPFLVEKHRVGHRAKAINIAQMIDKADGFAMPRATIFQKPKAKPAAKRG